MRTIKSSFDIEVGDLRDIIIALLSDIGYSAFEEDSAVLHAFIPEDLYDESLLLEVCNNHHISVSNEFIEPQNWNAIWEAGFEPVVVEGFCTVRAHFHEVDVTTPHTIVITPKMSFGTGHHATTQLMIMGMKELDFSGKSVLDFGTGTGVLAILAGMLGATDITGIDNDEWSVENAIENRDRNSLPDITISQASLEDLENRKYDIILANINRHILLHHMSLLFARLDSGGTLMMSGLLVEDEEIMRNSASDAGFSVGAVSVRNGWISMVAKK